MRFSNVNGEKFNCYTADSSVWTGATDKSNIRYTASNTSYFSWKLQYSYDVEVEMPRSAGAANMLFVNPKDPTQGGMRKTEISPFTKLLGFCR